MEITEIVAEELGELLDADVHTDYSGRGMFGDECFAVSTSQSGWDLSRTIMDIVAEEGNSETDDAIVYLSEHAPRTDSLGMDTVYYWPGLRVVQGD